MAKKKLTRLEQMGIIALIVVIACFFYVKKVYEPECKRFKVLKEKWIKLSKDVKDLKWKQGSSKSVLASIQEKGEELREVKSELKKSSAVLANKEELPEVLTKISRLASQYNLKVREFAPADGLIKNFEKGLDIEISNGVKRSFYNLTTVGTFLDFREFLRGLEFLPKLVMVEELMIERESENLRIVLLLSI